MNCPVYYQMADGGEFIDYQANRLVNYVGDLDHVEVHCLLSAAEHLFRKGRKPGTDKHDEKAQEWWLAQARTRYMERKKREWTGVKPFPAAKTESKFDLVVRNIFGNVIEEKERYFSTMRGE